MSTTELGKLAETARKKSEPVHREIEAAVKLEAAGFYTESALRIGRCMEAGLYELARELEVPLNQLVLPKIAKAKKELDTAQRNLLQNQREEGIQKLSLAVNFLVLAAAELPDDDTTRFSELSDIPRATDALLADLIAALQARNLKEYVIKLGGLKGQYVVLNKSRNNAAHASHDGTPREIAEEAYGQFVADCKKFIEGLLDAITGSRAPKPNQLVASEPIVPHT
jgi:hypothetical protein